MADRGIDGAEEENNMGQHDAGTHDDAFRTGAMGGGWVVVQEVRRFAF